MTSEETTLILNALDAANKYLKPYGMKIGNTLKDYETICEISISKITEHGLSRAIDIYKQHQENA